MEIKSIAENIIQRIKKEKQSTVIQNAVGRLDILHDNDDKIVYWVVVRPIEGSTKSGTNIHGEPTERQQSQANTLLDGPNEITVQRDRKLGELITQRLYGKIDYKSHPGFEDIIEISSNSQYNPVLYPEINATKGYIYTDIEEFTFSSLIDDLKNESLVNDIARIENDVSVSQAVKDKLINDLQNRIESIRLEKKQRSKYIKDSAALRNKPILDPQQDKIRRSNILKGSLIISGGPGTGKTTLLVQRITFLTSRTTLKDYRNLSKSDSEILFNPSKNWIFFSPSKLLRHYLKEVMNNEGLSAHNENVVVWKDYVSKVFKSMRMINTETNNPFQTIRRHEIIFNFTNTETLIEIITKFDQYLVDFQKQKIKRIGEIEIDNFSWKDLGDSIRLNLQVISKINSPSNLFNFFDTLSKTFYQNSKEYVEKINKLVSDLSAELLIKIEREQDLLKELEIILKENFTNKEIDESEITEEDLDDNSQYKNFELQIELNKVLKKLIRFNSLLPYKYNSKLSKKDRPVLEKLNTFFQGIDLKDIAEGEIFKKYFFKILRGFDVNIFSDFVRVYKQFRKEYILNNFKFTNEGHEQFKYSVENGNKKVDNEEMQLILILLFRLIRSLYDNSDMLFKKSEHLYISDSFELFKGVIAIDEATDFSILELICMSYLSHPQFKCVTLCGDLMQRLESKGINSWSKYSNYFKNTSIEFLNKSYRQTEYLIDIAKKIYYKNTGEKLDVIPSYPLSEEDPKPLIFKNVNYSEKIKWITERIIEIYSRFENQSPSIAVFLKSDEEILKMQKELNSSQLFEDNNITVDACIDEKLGEVEHVRLFNIKNIKGLEFRSVFFFDVDELFDEQVDLFDRYLYVGISRATFYLALTVKSDLPSSISYLSDSFFEETWE